MVILILLSMLIRNDLKKSYLKLVSGSMDEQSLLFIQDFFP
ncbi:hypothetical protein Q7C_200 [Methylophaga frappieri]|uniref:Uncharacterized protein n=1 Tax=Methylophaga frappieri (strain ATCC BAA-2434 / DSM 25690 / JAM7) TaxID=754477 RepID=I1YEN8_METFJ|nr:hypothetical protein Q7C_200 [Methylophaga frappieri]